MIAIGDGAQAEQVTNCVGQVRPIECVKVERLYAMVDEVHDLLGGNCCGDEMGRRGIILQSFESPSEPRWHGGAALARELGNLREIVDRHDAGHDRTPDAVRAYPFDEAEIVIVVEEKLRDDPRCTGIDPWP